MQNEISVFEKGSSVNILGLKRGQAELYKYLLSCTKDGKTVELEQVCILYYTYVAKTVRCFNYWEVNGPLYKRMDGMEYYKLMKKGVKEKGYNLHGIYKPGKNWLKENIGSFVMRGLLSVVPKFNPKEIEE